jgi:hypothetical protein
MELRELGCSVAHGTEELMEARERQMCLGLNPSRGQDSHAAPACHARGLEKQPRFADARLAVEHENLAVRGNLVQQRRQEALLFEAAE